MVDFVIEYNTGAQLKYRLDIFTLIIPAILTK